MFDHDVGVVGNWIFYAKEIMKVAGEENVAEDTILEEHVSPDGLLSLYVIKSDDGDITIGFVGYPWHTHGDILDGTSVPVAIRGFVDSLIRDEMIIAFYFN